MPRGMKIGHKIDKELSEKLCKMMCTRMEIVSVLGVSEDTLENWCKKEYGDTPYHVICGLADTGKARLRMIQMEQAEKNPTMAIWLGKQYLGQTDKVEQQNETRVVFTDDMEYEDDNGDDPNGASEV